MITALAHLLIFVGATTVLLICGCVIAELIDHHHAQAAARENQERLDNLERTEC